MEAVFNLYFDDEGCGGRASHMLRRRANIVSCHVVNCTAYYRFMTPASRPVLGDGERYAPGK